MGLGDTHTKLLKLIQTHEEFVAESAIDLFELNVDGAAVDFAVCDEAFWEAEVHKRDSCIIVHLDHLEVSMSRIYCIEILPITIRIKHHIIGFDVRMEKANQM